MERLGRRVLLGVLSLLFAMSGMFVPIGASQDASDCLTTLANDVAPFKAQVRPFLRSLEDFRLVKLADLTFDNQISPTTFQFPLPDGNEEVVQLAFKTDFRETDFQVKELSGSYSSPILDYVTPGGAATFRGSSSAYVNSLASLYLGRDGDDRAIRYAAGYFHYNIDDPSARWVFIEPLEPLLGPMRNVGPKLKQCASRYGVHVVYEASKTEFKINLEPRSRSIPGTVLPASGTSVARFTDALGRSVSEYGLGNSVFVTVADSQKNLSPSVANKIADGVVITNMRTNQGVTLSLTETEPNSGEFISEALVVGEDDSSAELVAEEGDLLRATYTDPTDPSDTSSASIVIQYPLKVYLVGIGDQAFYDLYASEITNKRWWEAQEEVLSMVDDFYRIHLENVSMRLSSLEAWTSSGPGSSIVADDPDGDFDNDGNLEVNAFNLLCHFAQKFVLADRNTDGVIPVRDLDDPDESYLQGFRIYHTRPGNPMIAHLFTGYDLGSVSSDPVAASSPRPLSDSGCCFCHSESCDTRGADIVGLAEGIGMWHDTSTLCLEDKDPEDDDPVDPVDLSSSHLTHHSLSQHAPESLGGANINYDSLLIQRVLLVAHEIGHNLGAEHSLNTSIMSPSLDTLGINTLGEFGLGESFDRPSAPSGEQGTKSENVDRIRSCLMGFRCDR